MRLVKTVKQIFHNEHAGVSDPLFDLTAAFQAPPRCTRPQASDCDGQQPGGPRGVWR